MIRINLVRNQIGEATQKGGPGFTGISPSLGGKPEVREAVTKLACIAVFTIALMVYEGQNSRGLDAERNTVHGQVTNLDSTLRAKETELDSVKDVAERARELEDKLKILKLLSHLRLREVKTLDFVQSSIPEKVWLKSLDYDTDKDDAVHGHLNFKGNAVLTDDLAEFTKRLEDSAYLEQVIIVKNQETAVGQTKSVTMRDFEFTAQSEVKN